MRISPLAVSLLLSISLPCAAAPQWLPFVWHVDSFANGPRERLALLLPVTIDGLPCLVQLDTGANGELMWSGQADPGEQLPSKPVTVELAGMRKQIPAHSKNLRYVTPEVCAMHPVATVGNGFFEQGTLTLDLGKARFAYAPQALLATDPAAQPFFYARWTPYGGHVLVELTVEGERPGYALLDTGAVRFGLAATNAEEWAALSGKAPLAATGKVRQYSLNSWGKQVQCFETPVTRNLTVAGSTLEQTHASYCVDQGFASPVKLVGVLGLRPFGDRTITLDYLSRRWTLAGAPVGAGGTVRSR
jgi:hypothetical protein